MTSIAAIAGIALVQLFELPPSTGPDVPFVATPIDVVDEMLSLASVGADDVVFDLGCGDGRIVIRAAEKYGARGVGIDVDGRLVAVARAAAEQAGVSARVEFREEDLFGSNLRDATVVTLYLFRRINLELRPKLLSELRPGTRIVSRVFDMGDWKPERTVTVHGERLFLWIVPNSSPVPGATELYDQRTRPGERP